MNFSDRERLDWLCSIGTEAEFWNHNGNNQCTFVPDIEVTKCIEGKTLREAIDAAMLAAGLKPRAQPSMEELWIVFRDAMDKAAYEVGWGKAGIRAVLARVGVELTPKEEKTNDWGKRKIRC